MSLCFMLTAGQGTRLKPHTDFYAKPTLPLLNLPLAYYGFFLARQAGFDSFLMNKHHLPGQIEKLAQDLSVFSSKVTTVDETQKLLGSGGALWNARAELLKHDSFLIANGDEVLIPKNPKILSELTAHFETTDSLCTLLTCDHPELLKSLKPVWIDEKNTVQGFGMESPGKNLHPVHYTGYKIFSSRIFDWLPEGESNIFYEVLIKAIKAGEKVTHLHLPEAHWYETGNPQSFFSASQSLQQHHWEAIKNRHRFFGEGEPLNVANESGSFVLDSSEQEKFIENCTGHVVLGKGASIPESAKINDAIIFPNQVGSSARSPETGLYL